MATASVAVGQGRRVESLRRLDTVAVIFEPPGQELLHDGMEAASIRLMQKSNFDYRVSGLIRVIPSEQVVDNPGLVFDNVASGLLHISVNSTSLNSRYPYAVPFRVELMQSIALTRTPKVLTMAPTWDVSNVAMIFAASQIRQLREAIKDTIDEFLNDYSQAIRRNEATGISREFPIQTLNNLTTRPMHVHPTNIGPVAIASAFPGVRCEDRQRAVGDKIEGCCRCDANYLSRQRWQAVCGGCGRRAV